MVCAGRPGCGYRAWWPGKGRFSPPFATSRLPILVAATWWGAWCSCAGKRPQVRGEPPYGRSKGEGEACGFPGYRLEPHISRHKRTERSAAAPDGVVAWYPDLRVDRNLLDLQNLTGGDREPDHCRVRCKPGGSGFKYGHPDLPHSGHQRAPLAPQEKRPMPKGS